MWIGIVAGVVMEIGSEFIPLRGVDGADFGNASSSFSNSRAETFVAHRCASESNDGVTFAEGVVYGKVIHRGNDLALGQVARSTEQNHGTRIGDPAVGHSGTHRFGSHACSLNRPGSTKMQG